MSWNSGSPKHGTGWADKVANGTGPVRRASALACVVDQRLGLRGWQMSDEAREEGFYWVALGQNPPEIGYWERGEWWLAEMTARGGPTR
jgi:hypothetical protein